MRSAVSLALLAVGALILGGAWLVDWRADRREARAVAEFPPEGEFVSVDGRRIHAVTRGAGPDVVLIHGASGNSRDFTFRFMGMLTDRYRVTAFDRPGLGHSDRARDGFGLFSAEAESPMEQADLLRAAAHELGIERPIVLGHSYGAAVALAWALGDQDGTAAVVDVAGVAMPWPGRLSRLHRIDGSGLGGAVVPPLITAFAPEGVVAAAVESTFAPDSVPEGYAEHLGTGLSIRRQTLRANARQVNTLRPHIVEMAERYASLSVPVEIVHGDADPTVPITIHALGLRGRAPRSNLVVLEDVGHMPHHVDPEAVIAAIDRAARLASGGSAPASP